LQERRKTGLFVNYDLLRKEAIKNPISLNIPWSRFKASKGWAIRFMHWMGLALRRRMTICQKLPKDLEQKKVVELLAAHHFSKIQPSTANLICIWIFSPLKV
jgi:hypothetical protein